VMDGTSSLLSAALSATVCGAAGAAGGVTLDEACAQVLEQFESQATKVRNLHEATDVLRKGAVRDKRNMAQVKLKMDTLAGFIIIKDAASFKAAVVPELNNLVNLLKRMSARMKKR